MCLQMQYIKKWTPLSERADIFILKKRNTFRFFSIGITKRATYIYLQKKRESRASFMSSVPDDKLINILRLLSSKGRL